MVFLVKQQSWRSILEKRLLLFRTIFWHCCPKWECKSSSLISYCLIHHFSSSSPLLNKSAILMFWSSSCFWIIHTRELLRHNNHPLLARRSSPSSECPTLSRVIRHVKKPQEFTILTQTCVSFKLLKCIEDYLALKIVCSFKKRPNSFYRQLGQLWNHWNSTAETHPFKLM